MEYIDKPLHTKSDNDFENIVDISPYPVIIHKMGLVLYANQICLDLFEMDGVDDMVGKNLLEFIYPEDQPKVVEAIKLGTTQKKSNAVLSNRILTKKGKVIDLETKSSSINFRGEECRLVVAYNYHLLSKVEAELKTQNLLIEKIAQIIPDSLIVVESKSRQVLFENKPLLETLGYSAEDLQSKDQFDFISSIIHKEDIPKLLEARKFIFNPENSGKYSTSEYRIKDKSGKWRWILARSTMFKSTEDGLQQINFGISQDITPLKEIQQQLLENQMFIDKINKTLPLHVSIFDLKNFNFVYRNYDIATTLGYKEDEIENILQLAHPDYAEEAIRNLESFVKLKEGEVKSVIGKYLTKTGQVKYLMTRTTPFLVDPTTNAVLQVLTTTADFTDLKETELKLQLSEETRKAILSALPDIVFQVDCTGVIRDFYANDMYRDLLNQLNLINRQAHDILPSPYFENLIDAINKAIASSVMQTMEYLHNERGFEMNYEFRISRLNETNGIVVVRDITNLITTRQQLDQKLDELSHKNEVLEKYITSNAELEKFAYIASHDLREPIRSIVGFTQLLQRRFDDKMDSEAKEFLGNIINSAQRMNTLVVGLLDYSRIASNAKPFALADLNSVLSKVQEDLKVVIEENKAQLVIKNLPEISCDELQIRQLFQNLISNAIKFRKESEAPLITISCPLDNGKVVFKIEDNGIGIDPNYQEKVFHIFSRLHSSDKYPGSGIGLAVCKKIVERHHGEIWIDSEVGKGTTFYFTLG